MYFTRPHQCEAPFSLCQALHHKCSETATKTIAIDTLYYTANISTTFGSHDMIEGPLESQDQLLYLTPPTLSIILTLSGATSQPLQNCQTLQRFLSPLYTVSSVYLSSYTVSSVYPS